MRLSSAATLAAALSLASLAGCAKTIVLTQPHTNVRLQIGKAPAPVFAWEHGANLDLSVNDPNLEYTLTVARDASFAAPVITKKIRNKQTYQMARGEGWLPSGESGTAYFWRVEGTLFQDTGETITLPCEAIRRFELEPRPTVAIQFAVPESPDGKDQPSRVTLERGEAQERTFTFTLEYGESRRVKIESVYNGQPVLVGGSIQVDAVNESTKYSPVIIDNVTVEKLVEVMKGGTGDYTYKVGNEEVVRMKLGGRVEF